MSVSQGRQQSGRIGYHAGQAAEDSVARCYAQSGMAVVHRRWRGRAGEVDLIVRHDDTVIFVEVKKSRDFARAAERLSPRQMARILAAGEEFVGGEPRGALTDMRFDVALVDARGAVQIIENALAA